MNKPDPLAVAYKQGWTAARNEWKPRAEKAETQLAELRAKARQEFDLGNDWMERALTAETELAEAREIIGAVQREMNRLAPMVAKNTDVRFGADVVIKAVCAALGG